jgi:outer membrane immunogenic protein
MKRALLATVAMIAVASTSALAADLPSRAMPPAAIVPLPLVYNWTGIYFGINGGYGFGKQDPLSLFSNDYNSFEYTANGWLAGGTLGAQIQSGHVVIGIESDLDWANISGSGTTTVTKLGVIQGTGSLSSKVTAISTLRTRVGYAMDNWLFYGTVGLAATKATSTFTQGVGILCNTPGQVPCNSKSDLHAGLAAGAGVEYGFTPNLSGKLEYIWLGAGATNTLKENILRAGLNWRFGGN